MQTTGIVRNILFCFQEHDSYYCMSDKHGPLLLSIRMDRDPAQYRLLLRYAYLQIFVIPVNTCPITGQRITLSIP